MPLQRFAYIQRTLRWSFRAGEKHQRHPIARRQSQEFGRCFSGAELLRASHDLIQLLL